MPPDGVGNGVRDADVPIGEIVNRISLHASALVREEIELAKAEMELKVKRLVRGAVVGFAAGFFLLLAAIYGFHALAWGLNDIFNEAFAWLGFLLVTGLLVLLAGLAGFIAYRSFRAGAPPTPDMAIEEAKRTKEALEHPEVQQSADA
ncbi:MAG: phage holin family protein [Solirubrobacterales bacterium]